MTKACGSVEGVCQRNNLNKIVQLVMHNDLNKNLYSTILKAPGMFLTYPYKIGLVVKVVVKNKIEETESIHVRNAIRKIEQNQAKDTEGP